MAWGWTPILSWLQPRPIWRRSINCMRKMSVSIRSHEKIPAAARGCGRQCLRAYRNLAAVAYRCLGGHAGAVVVHIDGDAAGATRAAVEHIFAHDEGARALALAVIIADPAVTRHATGVARAVAGRQACLPGLAGWQGDEEIALAAGHDFGRVVRVVAGICEFRGAGIAFNDQRAGADTVGVQQRLRKIGQHLDRQLLRIRFTGGVSHLQLNGGYALAAGRTRDGDARCRGAVERQRRTGDLAPADTADRLAIGR